ncbi:MAG: hypothetical protein U0798_06855 [Gemmataceae bacterium]
MVVIGTTTGQTYVAGPLLSRAGEGAVYRLDGIPSLLLKIFDRPLSKRTVQKINSLAQLACKPAHTAIPLESVYDPATKALVGFVQEYFSRTVPLTRVLDSNGRTSLRMPDDLGTRITLCLLLAEAFARIHATDLVVGDVSCGNLLLGFTRFRRIEAIYGIDCNSFQLTIRTPHGTETFVSGVATEEYAAPEVQPTDWATSNRSVYSDSFGLAVLTWKILFNGSHPFAVVTPRSVDVPPLGKRIEDRLFPFSPASPLPPGWSAPTLTPSLAVLPSDIREMFFRTFSSADARDRPTSDEWADAFRAWALAVKPSLAFRFLGAWNGSVSDRLATCLTRLKPWTGRIMVFAGLMLLTLSYSRLESTPSKAKSRTNVPSESAPFFTLFDPPRSKSTRPRVVDSELFPELVRKSSASKKE